MAPAAAIEALGLDCYRLDGRVEAPVALGGLATLPYQPGIVPRQR